MLNDVFPAIGKTTFQMMQNGNDAASGNGDFTPHTFSQEKVFCYANCASTFLRRKYRIKFIKFALKSLHSRSRKFSENSIFPKTIKTAISSYGSHTAVT